MKYDHNPFLIPIGSDSFINYNNINRSGCNNNNDQEQWHSKGMQTFMEEVERQERESHFDGE